MLAPARHALVVQLDPDHGEPVAGEHLGDPGAHGAETDDADGRERAGLRRLLSHGAELVPPASRYSPQCDFHHDPDPVDVQTELALLVPQPPLVRRQVGHLGEAEHRGRTGRSTARRGRCRG